MPVTVPSVPTVALAVAPLAHVPPVAVVVSAVVAPTHTVAAPVIVPALGSGSTVTACVAVAVPQLLVTV